MASNHAGGVYDDPDGKLNGLARPTFSLAA